MCRAKMIIQGGNSIFWVSPIRPGSSCQLQLAQASGTLSASKSVKQRLYDMSRCRMSRLQVQQSDRFASSTATYDTLCSL